MNRARRQVSLPQTVALYLVCISATLGNAFVLFPPASHQHSSMITLPWIRTHPQLSRQRRPVRELVVLGAKRSSIRWVGNFKPPIGTLSDIPKAKKHTLHLTVNGETKVLEKKKYESVQHVLVKALLWKLFSTEYPKIEIEKDIGDPNYLPDVISLADEPEEQGCKPLFWGESGRMSLEKALDLSQRYPEMHIVWMRWGISLTDFVTQVAPALASSSASRSGRFTLAAIPRKEVWEFIDDDCNVIISKEDVEWFEIRKDGDQ